MKVKKTAMKAVAAIATKTAQANANQRCAWLIHQPKMPDAVKKLRKF
jgi:cyclic lactone autoinducer peptide